MTPPRGDPYNQTSSLDRSDADPPLRSTDRQSMPRRHVNQLANGEAVDDVFLVVDKQLRVNRQGGLYLHLDLRDKTGVITCRFWNATEETAQRFDAGDYLAVRGKTNLHQGHLQLIIAGFEVVDPSTIDPADFVAASRLDPAHLASRLRAILMGISNPHLRALVECFLIDSEFVDKFSLAPAGVKNHHAYPSGLLEHVVTLLEMADRVSGLYPELDRDLLLTGVFLHDIGKTDELSYDRAYGYTDEGQLVGHLVMGVVMLRDKVRRTPDLTGEPFPTELLLRLEHMIVSHHGSYEFGSPKLPMTPEAVVLHHLDTLDAKLHLYTREIRDDPSPTSSWTAYNQNLGRRLFKGQPPQADSGR